MSSVLHQDTTMQFQLLSLITFLFIQRDFAGYVEPTRSAYAGDTLPLLPRLPPTLYRRPALKHHHIAPPSPPVTYINKAEAVRPVPYPTAPEMPYMPGVYITQPRRSHHSPAYHSYYGYLPTYHITPTTIARPYGTYHNAYIIADSGVQNRLRPRYHPLITVRNFARSHAREIAQASDTTAIFGETEFNFGDPEMVPRSNYYKNLKTPWDTFLLKPPFDELSE